MPGWPDKNLLCYGDNLAFLKDFPDEAVDLIYLDPPFNSQQSYNVLFKEVTGAPEAAQIKAFEDTWTWDLEANKALTEIQRSPEAPPPLVELTRTFMAFLKPSPMSAYLVQMAVRLVQMHRVLKSTGSLYLHCDPTASHYLKLILDAIFGPRFFRNEITWQRTNSHNDAGQYGRIHDVILFYVKSESYTWNSISVAYSPEQLKRYKPDDKGRLYTGQDLTASRPDSDSGKFEWRGTKPPSTRGWGYTVEQLEKWWNDGRILLKKDGTPRMDGLKVFLDQMPGKTLQSVWTDIPRIPNTSAERMGYPTQKPLELLKRIVAASSNPGDVVLDPFCGCGTTIDAVETLNRENPDKPPRLWVGIDVAPIAMNLIKSRLATRFSPLPVFTVLGEPTTAAGAAALAAQDPHDFQTWALGLVGARPAGGKPKKGADKGIDGVRFFQDEQKGGVMVSKKIIVQVKSGHVKAGDVRDLVGTITREAAEMGVFITLEPSTQPMRTEAAAAGTYLSPYDKQAYPKIQILTIEEILKDPHRPNPRCLQIPGGAASPNVTLPQAPRHKSKRVRQQDMDFEDRARGEDR